ncbi:bifunctional riboflavin biosynthesis RIBA 1, chloroplastic-like [Olea europaea subsp. europaea]|uniref:3,4-dihydroxy-2-butanone-4-phosphate synthase n=1 Tax=Olea europaea subsp. europaea TaxID=158383 RepID=A0A8S0RLK6_OLEEU|nr:bifunctional riboflavin biosynthesis RIBA 1, chloroplastic-like [Olea europaea subsp. europaea]
MQILRDLGVNTITLMTNNPAKYSCLKGYGLAVAGRVPLVTPIARDVPKWVTNGKPSAESSVATES